MSAENEAGATSKIAWWKEMTGYHWFVLLVAALGWMFDCLDQQLFLLARTPAMTELIGKGEGVTPGVIKEYGGYATTIFMLGWATGGLVFGVIGDRLGRAKTMMITILLYSLFTGLSSLSTGFADFAVYRFLTGLGVGGEFAVGVALVAESLPASARSHALGLLQALSAVGNITAAFVSIRIGQMQAAGALGGEGQWSAWRWMFVIGALPALLALVIRWRLKEPEAWVKAKEAGSKTNEDLGSYRNLFKSPAWRKNAIIGVTLACSGVFALWGIVFFCFELVRDAFEPHVRDQVVAQLKVDWAGEGLSDAQVDAKLAESEGTVKKLTEGGLKGLAGRTGFWLNVGAFFGMVAFSYLTAAVGRIKAFAVTYIAALVATAGVFWFLRDPSQIPWMIFSMGFCMLALFAGYAIYLPELFPTHLRSTGTSFCYNVGRYVGAFAPMLFGLLVSKVFSEANGFEQGVRYAGITMCVVFVIGLLVLPFAPETKGKPLPEDESAFGH